MSRSLQYCSALSPAMQATLAHFQVSSATNLPNTADNFDSKSPAKMSDARVHLPIGDCCIDFLIELATISVGVSLVLAAGHYDDAPCRIKSRHDAVSEFPAQGFCL